MNQNRIPLFAVRLLLFIWPVTDADQSSSDSKGIMDDSDLDPDYTAGEAEIAEAAVDELKNKGEDRPATRRLGAANPHAPPQYIYLGGE